MDKLRFAAKVRALREATGLSRLDFAEEAGVAKVSLEEIELKGGNPTLDTLLAIAGKLKVPLGALLPDEEQASGDEFRDVLPAVTLLSRYEDAPAANRALVLAILHEDLSYLERYPSLAHVQAALKEESPD